MPTRAAIETHFSAGPATVQRALDSLARDGFIESRGCKGTFVKREPPHLTRYGLVFPEVEPKRNRFWYSLHNEALKVMDALEGRSLAVYLGVDLHRDTPDYQRLMHDLERHRLAGLIFATVPFALRNTPMLDQPGIARVAYASSTSMGFPNVTAVPEAFERKASEYLAQRGRRRVAIISAPLRSVSDHWAHNLQKVGLETRPFWLQRVNLHSPFCAGDVVRLLMECRELPDALIITDDNLVEDATLALKESGVKVPEDLEVVVHCNFPYPPANHVPVKRLGFDSRQVLLACIESIDRQVKGEPVAETTWIPAVFEDEIEP